MIYPYEGVTPIIDATAFIAPGAVVIGKVKVGPGASIWYNCVVRGDYDSIKIGACSNIQDGSVLHEHAGFPLYVGDRVTVGHRALLHGCTVEDDAYIGMGAMILNGARIGAGAVVGAGSLVLQGQEVPPGTIAVGVPATIIRLIEEKEMDRFRGAVGRYLKLAKKHKKILEENGD
ncbi:MAG: gamma carbonic anhydrase family protein [Desulfotomaculaceae bacterium]|nr:gamma carbonic anhydrase family protein [Desulfotomaculaceae bacterium]